MKSLLRSLKRPISASLQWLLGHQRFERLRFWFYIRFVEDAGYSRAWYESDASEKGGIYQLFAEAITAEFHPSSLVDVGCGHGGISAALMKLGCREINAFDFSRHAVAMARERGLPRVEQLDVTQVSEIPARGELCVCLEVAEHVPEKYANRLCEMLSQAAPRLVFTAAPPGQGGHLHVNMQPRIYWIERFTAHGMEYDADAVTRIRACYSGRMIRDYDENLMVFRRRKTLTGN